MARGRFGTAVSTLADAGSAARRRLHKPKRRGIAEDRVDGQPGGVPRHTVLGECCEHRGAIAAASWKRSSRTSSTRCCPTVNDRLPDTCTPRPPSTRNDTRKFALPLAIADEADG